MADLDPNCASTASLAVPAGVRLAPVPRCNGLYDAGSDGHIYCHSTARNNSKKPKPFRLHEAIGSEGYPFVSVVIDGRRKTKSVHGLVCAAFHGQQDGKVVRHLDGSRTNNVPENLCWGSYAENEADKRRHGRTACGERHGNVKLTKEAVRIIRASIPFGLWNASDAAKVFGMSESAIRSVANGRGWEHLGETET